MYDVVLLGHLDKVVKLLPNSRVANESKMQHFLSGSLFLNCQFEMKNVKAG